MRAERSDMFKMAVRVAYRIEGRCPRHRAYNPVKDEQGGIKGECPTCYELLNAYRAYLSFREAIEKTTTQALQQLSMPTREDFVSLSERMTNLEMRLDDMDAKLDRIERRLEAPMHKDQIKG